MQPAQPMLSHYCNCTYNTPVPYFRSVFSQKIFCAHCGSMSTDINGRGNAEEQASIQQDELTQLFTAHMNLSQPASRQPSPAVQAQPQEAPKQIVYASQHYTHSYHVAPTHIASEPLLETHAKSFDLEAVLLHNNIDPSRLFPSQLELLQNADDDQRLRLLELWRISPLVGGQGYLVGSDYNLSRQLYDWPPTSLAQEEAMAKLRYERMEQQSAQQPHQQQQQYGLDMSINIDDASAHTQSAEPYMTSGYEMMARREYEKSAQSDAPLKESNTYNKATDPVYDGGLWQKKVGNMLDMENQYGAYAYAREYGIQPSYGDEEMVM